MPRTRREFVRDLGLSAAALPFVLNLPSLGFANQSKRKQRIVFVFSPNGIVPTNFWPDEEGAKFTLKEILKPLAPFQDKLLTLHGEHGPRRYALIRTDRDWLLHLTKEQPTQPS